MFANNGTEWVTESGKEIDYLVIAGDTPAEIEENYMTLTGKPPMMPEYGMGFWQCKLRYWNQEQLLSVARKYKELGVPLDVIVVDFFHWTKQGEFKFDPKYWPDVPGMCRELKEMGIQVVVSVWPTVDIYSENFEEMKEKGYLVRTEHGVPLTMLCGGNEVFFDATNPDARTYDLGKNQRKIITIRVQNSSGWMWQSRNTAFTISRTTAISSEAYRRSEIFIRNII